MSNYRNCIYSSICTQPSCDMSCVKNAISDMLLAKCQISLSNSCFKANIQSKLRCDEIINLDNNIKVVQTIKLGIDPIQLADVFTYVGILNMCQHHGSSVSVYHLRFSKYLRLLKDSWTSGESSQLNEIQSFINSSKLLIISGLDFINLKDFESQTLLTIFQDRVENNLNTVVCISSVLKLLGIGPFYKLLIDKLKGDNVSW